MWSCVFGEILRRDSVLSKRKIGFINKSINFCFKQNVYAINDSALKIGFHVTGSGKRHKGVSLDICRRTLLGTYFMILQN